MRSAFHHSIFVSIVVLCSTAFAPLQGLWDGPGCRAAIARMDGAHREALRLEAVQKGIFDPDQVEEYINRRVRMEVLLGEDDAAHDADDVMGLILESLEDSVSDALDRTAAQAGMSRRELTGRIVEFSDVLRDGVRGVLPGLGRQKLHESYGGRAAADAAPLTFEVLQARPPLTPAEFEQVRSILIGMRLTKIHRAVLSGWFVQHPDLNPRDRIDPKSLAGMYWDVQGDTAMNAQAFYPTEPVSKVLADYAAAKTPMPDEKRYADLEAKLLASKAVPEGLKVEIRRERDHLTKFAFKMHPGYALLLDSTAKYFVPN